MTSEEQQLSLSGPRRAAVHAAGVLLFLFIPAVLFLFVAHPAPVGASLALGLALMLGHRPLARAYMRRVLPIKCIWCNCLLPAALEPGTTLDLAAGPQLLPARCCAGHRPPAARFFAFLRAARVPLAAGIFVPLALLLAALLAKACGWERAPLLEVTALFRLVVGLTVSVAAWGPALAAVPEPRAAIAVPFPVHNFYLLGVRALLWIFRLAGAWWVVAGVRFWL